MKRDFYVVCDYENNYCDCREAYALHTSVKDVVYNARSFARYLGVYNDYRFVHVTVYDGVDYDGPVVFEAWS